MRGDLANYRQYAANVDIIEAAVHQREVLLENMKCALIFVRSNPDFATAMLEDALEFADTAESRRIFDPTWPIPGFTSKRMLAAPKQPKFVAQRVFLGKVRRSIARRMRSVLGH